MATLSRRELLKAAAAGGACAYLGKSAVAAESTPASAEAFVREASFWEKASAGRVECALCPRDCRTAEGERGHCGVRENRQGRLYTLVFGRVVAAHLDPIEKKPLFHFLPGSRAFSIATAGCNIECKFCQNWRISQARPETVPAVNMPPEKVVATARAARAPVIAYTYSEPVVFYEYMYETAKLARSKGIHSVMITNGYIYEEPMRKLCDVLSAVKVDLKAFTWKFYKKICSGELQPVLETLRLLKSVGMWTEIVVLLIPGHNDSEEEIRRMSKWIREELGPDVPVHFSRFHPMYKMQSIQQTPRATLERARRVAFDEGLHFVYIGNLPGHEAESTYCPSCKTRLVHRFGYVIRKNIIRDGKCPKCATKIPGVWKYTKPVKLVGKAGGDG